MSDNFSLSVVTDNAPEKVSFVQSADSSAVKKNGASDQSFSSALQGARETRQLFEDDEAEVKQTELVLAANMESPQLFPQYGNDLPNWGNINLTIRSAASLNDLNASEIADVKNSTISSTLWSSNHSTLNANLPMTGDAASDTVSEDPQLINTSLLNTAAVNTAQLSRGIDTSAAELTSGSQQAISPAHPNFTQSASRLVSDSYPLTTFLTDNLDDSLNSSTIVNPSISNEKSSLVPVGLTPVHIPLSVIAPKREPIRSDSTVPSTKILDIPVSSINSLEQSSTVIDSSRNIIGSQFTSGATLWNNLMGQATAQGQMSEINKLASVESATDSKVDSLLEETPLISSSSSTRIDESGLPKSFFQLTGKLQSPQWGQELAQKVQVLIQNNLQQVQLQVNPKHLGPVEISIVMSSDQQVSVTFHVQNAQVKDAIDAAMPRLKEMLDQQGLNLADANVSHQSNQEKTSDRDSLLSANQERGSFLSDEDQSADQVEGYYLDEQIGRLDLFA